jgi:hypothetical protein
MELNEKIKAYLQQSNIAYSIEDYQTGQPVGEEDQILLWNEKLGIQPTTEQLEAAWTAKLNADAAIAYKTQRAAEYPAAADYLDGIVKGDQAQIQAYIDACLAVKAKYPKPE